MLIYLDISFKRLELFDVELIKLKDIKIVNHIFTHLVLAKLEDLNIIK